jgi:hypothetical protein
VSLAPFPRHPRHGTRRPPGIVRTAFDGPDHRVRGQVPDRAAPVQDFADHRGGDLELRDLLDENAPRGLRGQRGWKTALIFTAPAIALFTLFIVIGVIAVIVSRRFSPILAGVLAIGLTLGIGIWGYSAYAEGAGIAFGILLGLFGEHVEFLEGAAVSARRALVPAVAVQ